MIKLKDIALNVQTQLNSIAEYLGKSVRYIITDTIQDYESYIKLKDGAVEYVYTPGVVSVLSPIIPSAQVGLYTGSYSLNLYGYADDRSDLEDIHNYWMANYSGIGGVDIGSLNDIDANINPKDGYAERGSRFEASVVLNITTSLNVEINKGSDIKVYIDDEKVEYVNLQVNNSKSVLNTSFNPTSDDKLVTDSITLTLPLTMVQMKRYALVDGEYIESTEGEYLKTAYDNQDYYYLIVTQRFSKDGDDYVENDNGPYIRLLVEDTDIYLIPELELLEDDYGSEKINELFALGVSGRYNVLNNIRLSFRQHEKVADYVLTDFAFNIDNENIPVSFTLDYMLAYNRHPITIDGEQLKVLGFGATNNAVENTNIKRITDEEQMAIVSKSVLEASVKGWNMTILHDQNSEVSSALLVELMSDMVYENEHELKVKLPISNGDYEKTYTVMLKGGEYTLGESGLLTYTVDFVEKGE